MKARYDDLDEYIADLKAEIAGNEQCANHHYNLGLALLSKRDFVAAEESFLEAVRNSPHLAEAYVQLGGICLERGDLDGCLRYNEEAANCRAKFPVPWGNIAFVHLQRGEPDKAITALNKALKWDPNFVQAQNALVQASGEVLQMSQARFDRGVDSYLDVLKDFPSSNTVLNTEKGRAFCIKSYQFIRYC